MIDCEVKLASIRYATDQWIRVEASDLDCDGAEEIYLANAAVSACLAPDSGGTLYEFNAKETCYPLLNTLARRYEAYHDRVHELSRAGEEEKVASIHDRVRAKQDKLETLLVYDSCKRTSLIDRFLKSDATVQALQDNSAEEQGDFVERPYEIEQIEARENVQVVLGRTSLVQSERGEILPINISKTITMLREHAGLSVDVTITNSGAEQLSTRYAQEWNFSMLAGEAPDRYYLADGEMCGNLSTVMMRRAEIFSLVDEWRRTAVRLTPGAGTDVEFWTYPVKTVSQSEDGFEGLYQCSAVIVTFPIALEPGERETFHIDLDVEVRPCPRSGEKND
jgi:alpha-amylase